MNRPSILVLIITLLTILLITFPSHTLAETSHFGKQIPSHVQEVIIEITDSTAHLIDSGNWFLMVYAPWCSFCEKQFPLLITTAERVKENPQMFPNTKIAIIDGTTNPILDKRFVVGGYPTLYNLKDGKGAPFGHQRTIEAFLFQLSLMANPAVEVVSDRGHAQRLQGTQPGHWSNVFIYLGANVDQYREFQSCAEQYQGTARFYSPYGYQDDQQIHLSNSLWLGHPDNWEKHWEHVGREAKQSLLDLTDFFGVPFHSLPTVVNQVAGRNQQIYSGAWDTGSAQTMCTWVKSLLSPPIEALSPLIFHSVTERSDVFLLMSIADNTQAKMAQLAILPSIALQNVGLFDHFVWTSSNLIPRLRAHYRITASDFILVVNRDLSRYWLKTDELGDEEAVLAWLKKMREDPDFRGQSLYHWANIITPIVKDLAKWGERFTADHLVFFLGLACTCVVLGLLIGLVIITYCMEDTETKIQRLKTERDALEHLTAAKSSPSSPSSKTTTLSQTATNNKIANNKMKEDGLFKRK